ncbi:hypothetical protein LC1Nh_0934 [Candidatus Nanohalobium constans]|uniref:Uncharacterized protein n=2 Tax=Candidatus Nanohalobium constans TaxID=2565781 RepID=A0A5Q0UGW1_9ARCH|nr:hypothetical protein LC1Nh_0934 [Candidatus Nanohalobium constans]
MTLTSTKKILLITLLLAGFVSTVSADFYYGSGGISTSSDYFTTPEFSSQQEIATELVAPFIFITVLLHFALSKALNFIMAEDVEKENYHAIPYGIPLREKEHGHDRLHPDARKYAMIMSLTITASLVPTPYWDIIRGAMGLIGIGTAIAFATIIGFVIYLMAKVP